MCHGTSCFKEFHASLLEDRTLVNPAGVGWKQLFLDLGLEPALLEEVAQLHGDVLEPEEENVKLRDWVEVQSTGVIKLQAALAQSGGQRGRPPDAVQPVLDAAAVTVEVGREANAAAADAAAVAQAAKAEAATAHAALAVTEQELEAARYVDRDSSCKELVNVVKRLRVAGAHAPQGQCR